MTMDEIAMQVSFMLGIPANSNVEELDVRQAVLIAFREAKRYMRIPALKTVPFSTRIQLEKQELSQRAFEACTPLTLKLDLTCPTWMEATFFSLLLLLTQEL